MYSLTIGMCTGGTVQAETVTSLIGAMDVVKDKGIPTYLSLQIGGYTAHNRNTLVETAKKNNSTHLMFIDADQTFPPSGIVRLFDHDKDIVGGVYNTRGSYDESGKLISTVKLADDDGNLLSGGSIPSQLFKCWAVPTGFILIKMSVFDKIDKPYFVAWESEEGEHHTEDVDFCEKAHKAGFDIWCSPTIKIGHIGNYVY